MEETIAKFKYPIQMVDLKGQYQQAKSEIDEAIMKVIGDATFINGPIVKEFAENLAKYLGVKHVIPCANGTDALQIALMALDLKPNDEVILPGFTYVATAEVIALLGLKPVIVDVNPENFNISITEIEKNITARTKVIIPVHLFGQNTDMSSLLPFVDKYGIKIIEDAAQSIGSNATINGVAYKSGTIGHIGCTSFFPSKNLGCYGDGGAMFTNDDELAVRLKMIANHGQSQKYYHQIVGVNSRLDSVQAAILNVKLKYLGHYITQRRKFASHYDARLTKMRALLTVPQKEMYSNHVYHQYTVKVSKNKRDDLMNHLKNYGIPTMIYYPLPLYKQAAYSGYGTKKLPITESLCNEVLSLPVHSEYDAEMVDFICDAIAAFK